MRNDVTLFLRRKSPYLLGFALIEATLYYFDGVAGDFITGLPALFALWVFYSLMSR